MFRQSSSEPDSRGIGLIWLPALDQPSKKNRLFFDGRGRAILLETGLLRANLTGDGLGDVEIAKGKVVSCVGPEGETGPILRWGRALPAGKEVRSPILGLSLQIARRQVAGSRAWSGRRRAQLRSTF